MQLRSFVMNSIKYNKNSLFCVVGLLVGVLFPAVLGLLFFSYGWCLPKHSQIKLGCLKKFTLIKSVEEPLYWNKCNIRCSYSKVVSISNESIVMNIFQTSWISSIVHVLKNWLTCRSRKSPLRDELCKSAGI